MKEETKNNIIAGIIVSIIVTVAIITLFSYIGYMFDKTKDELHNRIRVHLLISKEIEIVTTIGATFGLVKKAYY